MSTPVASIVAPPEPLGTAGPPSWVGAAVAVSSPAAPVDPVPGEIEPTVPGLWVLSAFGTRTANGPLPGRPRGAERPGPPRDSGSSRVPSPGVGWRTWSL